MTRDQTALRLAVQATILKALAAADKTTRIEATEEEFTRVGQREPAVLGDRTIGAVSLDKGRTYWTVTDEEAFLDWVAVFRPEEIVQAVRSSYRDAVLAACKRDGGVIDQEGEVVVPPGVTQRTTGPTLNVRTTPDALEVVKDYLGDAVERLGIER